MLNFFNLESSNDGVEGIFLTLATAYFKFSMSSH